MVERRDQATALSLLARVEVRINPEVAAQHSVRQAERFSDGLEIQSVALSHQGQVFGAELAGGLQLAARALQAQASDAHLLAVDRDLRDARRERRLVAL